MFCEKLAAKTGLKVSLPTEAQWEYACRAGTNTRFYFGDDPAELYTYANYADRSSWRTPCEYSCTKPGGQDKSEPGWDIDDGFERTAPVGSFKPNNWGLYDMHGNVREWVNDWAGGYLKSGTVDPTGPATGTFHASRGGGWWSPPSHCNAYGHNGGHGPGGVQGGWGCRVVVALK